jgi:hypothetical protein
MDISERAYDAIAQLMRTTSGAPSAGELAKTLERFAMSFAYDAALKMTSYPDSDGARIAVLNCVDRAAKGEP